MRSCVIRGSDIWYERCSWPMLLPQRPLTPGRRKVACNPMQRERPQSVAVGAVTCQSWSHWYVDQRGNMNEWSRNTLTSKCAVQKASMSLPPFPLVSLLWYVSPRATTIHCHTVHTVPPLSLDKTLPPSLPFALNMSHPCPPFLHLFLSRAFTQSTSRS